jgi:hypothetical protein
VFTLNTKLAEAESMTHDVLRDLLGIKTDMNNVVVSALLLSENRQSCLEVFLVLSFTFN